MRAFVWKTQMGSAYSMDFRDLDEQLRYLRQMITVHRQDNEVRMLTQRILTEDGAQPRDRRAQALAIGQWVQENIFYVNELDERFQPPDQTIRERQGDCDDMSVLIGAMCESIGIPIRLVCMKINYAWRHIFPAAVMGSGSLLPLDATMSTFSVREQKNPVEWAVERGKDVRIKLA